MPIRVACVCGKQLQVPDTAAGRKVRCPACQAVVSVPDSTPSTSESVDKRPAFGSGSRPAPPLKSTPGPAVKEEESRTARDEKPTKPTKRSAERDEDEEKEAPTKKSGTKSSKATNRDEEDEPVSAKSGSKSSKRIEEEDEDEAEARSPRKSTKKKSMRDDDADDEGTKKAPRKKRPLWMILLGLGCGGFLLLTCLGVGAIGGFIYYLDSQQEKVAGKWVIDQNAPENASLPAINKAMQFEFAKEDSRCTMRVLGVDFLGKWSVVRNRENDAILVIVDFEEARGPDGQKVKSGKEKFTAAFEITPVDADHIDLVDIKDRKSRMRMKKVTSFEKVTEPAKNLDEFASVWK